MKRSILILALTGMAAACDGLGGADSQTDGATAAATAEAKAQADEAKSKSEGNGARSVAEETDDFLFEYAYPAAAGRIPGLAGLLDNRLDRQRAELASDSERARREARQQAPPLRYESDELLALTAYVAQHSRSMPRSVTIDVNENVAAPNVAVMQAAKCRVSPPAPR